MSKIDVNLEKWINDLCPYKGCKYNEDGYCQCEDQEFLLDRLSEIRGYFAGGLHRNSFSCYLCESKEDKCLHCNSELVKNFEYSEAWGVEKVMPITECPNGC